MRIPEGARQEPPPVHEYLCRQDIPMTKKTYSEQALLRSNNYRQIYHLFEYPAENAGIFLCRDMDLSCLDQEGTCRLKSIQDNMKEHLQGMNDLEKVEAEYVRLFDYRPVCAPYENAYRRDFLAHDLVSGLAVFYKNNGAKCDEIKAPDHISVELEFMHYLCYQEGVAALEKADIWRETQQRFFSDHLLLWVPSFSAILIREAALPYCLLGELMKTLMETECLILA